MNKVIITNNMKEFLRQYKDLLQCDPTGFLMYAEGETYFTAKEIVNFIMMFDNAGVKFDINKLFEDESYQFSDKYIKYDLTNDQIEGYFMDEIIANPKMSHVVTNVPEDKFKSLSSKQVERAIKNSITCFKIGQFKDPITSIGVQLLFNHENYNIEPCISINHQAYYIGVSVGVWIPNYGFMLESDIFNYMDSLSDSLLASLSLEINSKKG